MQHDLMKEPIIYEALFEIEKIRTAKEKALVRQKAIEDCKKISSTVKEKLKEKSERLTKLLDEIICLEEPDSEKYEMLCAACSVYNSQIYFLLQSCRSLRLKQVYKKCTEDTKYIFQAVGERSGWEIFFNNHSGIIIIGSGLAVIVEFVFVLLCTLFCRDYRFIMFFILSLIIIGIVIAWFIVVYPYCRDAGISRMAARIYNRHTYFSHKKKEEMSKVAFLEIASKLKDLGKF